MALAENVTDLSEYREERNQNAHPIEVLVLTGDDAFLGYIRESSSAFQGVHHAATLQQVGELLSKQHIGVVVIDVAFVGSKIEQLIRKLNTRSTHLVSLVVGKRDNKDLLMDLVNGGIAYRFLLLPLSPGRVRIAIDACIKHHLLLLDLHAEQGVDTDAPAIMQAEPETSKPVAQAAAEHSAGSSSDRKIKIVIAVLLMLITGGGAWWLFSSGEQESASDLSSASTGMIANDSKSAGNKATQGGGTGAMSVQELMSAARDARNAGLIFNPQGRNALEFYSRASQISPADAQLQKEFSIVIDEAMGMAQAALIERRAEVAADALSRIALVDPDNSRLSFLSAQLEQMRFSDAIDAARASIQASRFDDAERSIDEADALSPSDKSELYLVIAELEVARKELLTKASARLAAGKLVSPRQDSARYYYDLVLKSDPDNAAARQGLSTLASTLVLQARNEIDRNRFSRAEALLSDARKVDPTNRELSAVTKALSDARNSIVAKQQRKADAQKRQQSAALEAQARAERERVEAEAQKVRAEKQKADDLAEIATRPLGPQPELRGRLMPMSELDRERHVKPKYPTELEMLRVKGWVNVVFTVDTDGSTKDIEVQASEPGDLFDESVITAVKRWKFEPVEKDGVELAQRTGIRLIFKPGNWKTGVGTITEW